LIAVTARPRTHTLANTKRIAHTTAIAIVGARISQRRLQGVRAFTEGKHSNVISSHWVRDILFHMPTQTHIAEIIVRVRRQFTLLYIHVTIRIVLISCLIHLNQQRIPISRRHIKHPIIPRPHLGRRRLGHAGCQFSNAN